MEKYDSSIYESDADTREGEECMRAERFASTAAAFTFNLHQYSARSSTGEYTGSELNEQGQLAAACREGRRDRYSKYTSYHTRL